MTDKAKEARRQYMREYYSKNKEKVKQSIQRYWERKAKETKLSS